MLRQVRDLVQRAYTRAKEVIHEHVDLLHRAAQKLIEEESITGEEFLAMFAEEDKHLYLH